MSAVQQKVNFLVDAVQRGDLIDQNLNAVKRGSCKWRMYVLLTCLLRPFYCLFGKDPFGAFRIGNVANAVLKFCEDNKEALSTDLKAKLCTHVLTPLGNKSKGKYAVQVQEATRTLRGADAIPVVASVVRRNQDVESAIGTFAYQLHLRLSQPGRSVCFSPFSIAPVLGMILMGMDGDRKQQFLQALGLNHLPEEVVHSAIRALINHVSSGNGALCTITAAQALAFPVAGGVFESYKAGIAQSYQAEMFGIGRQPEEVCRAINAWVRMKTQGQIQNLVTPADIPTDASRVRTPFALLNGVYFKGKWSEDFSPAFSAPFHLENGQQIQVKTMPLTRSFRIFEGDTYRMLMIPYQSPSGHSLYFTVFLPNEGENLGALEARLTPEFVAAACTQAGAERCRVRLPKMNLDLRVSDLRDTLISMGLPLNASLDRLGVDAELTKVIHQAKMQVDERGTVATAATAGIGLCMACAPGMEEEPKEFFVDRPFAYILMDGPTALFQGNVRSADALVQ